MCLQIKNTEIPKKRTCMKSFKAFQQSLTTVDYDYMVSAGACTYCMILYAATMFYTRVRDYLNKNSFSTSKLIFGWFNVGAIRSKHQGPQFTFKMNEVYLRREEKTDTFDISFRFVNSEEQIDRQFNFCRKVNSTVSNFLSRIDTNVGKILNRKNKRKKVKNSTDEDAVAIKECKSSLMLNGERVDGELLCENVFNDKSNVSLVILGTELSIRYNAPWVSSIALAKCILAGFPTYPAKFECYNTNQTESTFTWYANDKSKPDVEDWKEVAQGYIYIPQVSEIGCKLKLECVPEKNGQIGPTAEVQSTSTVEAGPGRCPFEMRHSFTSERLSGQWITTYNILADLYTDSDYSREVLFPYCPAYALDIDYRKHLIIKELIGYNSDIICLQEVDNKVFEYDLLPTLGTLNYQGVFNRKGGTVSEGLSTFFNDRRFRKLDFQSVIIGENVDLDKFDEVWKRIDNEKMKERFLCRSTSVQATTLSSIDNPFEILVIGNTHLYFHPDADHIRLLQGYYALVYVRNIADKAKEKYPNHNVSIVLCGDFNSVPECGIYQLMSKNHIPDDYKDWQSNNEEIVKNVSLSHELSIASACGTPQYTNFTTGFADCLDYIFYQTERLKVEQVIPMPSNEDLTEHTALPSVVFPSDHISLCADLKWNVKSD